MSLLRSLYSAIGDRWLNPPTAIALAEDKPRQLTVAAALGFRIPETLISNDYDAVENFVAGGRTIAKPLHTALLDDGDDAKNDRVIFANRIDGLHLRHKAAVAAAPVIYQREIMKALDIRVTIVGQKVFATAIHSQENDETAVDWRRGTHPELPHTRHELPDELASKCVELVKQLGLRFGAADFVLDNEGSYWFLEVNPNGQWAWIENRTGFSISVAIVDELFRIDAENHLVK